MAEYYVLATVLLYILRPRSYYSSLSRRFSVLLNIIYGAIVTTCTVFTVLLGEIRYRYAVSFYYLIKSNV